MLQGKTVSVSFCRSSGQDCGLQSFRDVADEPITDIQQHRLLGSIQSGKVFCFEAVSVRPASREKCYATFTRLWSELLHQQIVLTMTYLATFEIHNCLFHEELCTALLTLRAPACGPRAQFGNLPRRVLFCRLCFLGKVHRRVAASERFVHEFYLTEVRGLGFDQMVTAQEFTNAVTGTFHHAEPGTCSAAAERLRDAIFRRTVSAALPLQLFSAPRPTPAPSPFYLSSTVPSSPYTLCSHSKKPTLDPFSGSKNDNEPQRNRS